MENKISKQSVLFKNEFIKNEYVYELLMEDFYKKQINNLLTKSKLGKIETKLVYTFICENKDLSQKCMNSILDDKVKLFLRIHSHTGTWYDDNYTPYCGQNQIKCSGPRMQLMDYGYKCLECKNEISFSGIRLKESTLNLKIQQNISRMNRDENLEYPIKVQSAGIYGITNSNFEKYLKDNNIELTDENRYELIHKYLESINPNTNYIICYKNEYDKLPKILREGSYGIITISEFIFVEDLLNKPDESITDSNLIRTIAQWSIRNNSNILNNKIKSKLQFVGLYPHVQKIYNINPNSNKNE